MARKVKSKARIRKRLTADIMGIIFPIMSDLRIALEADRKEGKLNLSLMPTVVANKIVDRIVDYICDNYE